MSGLTSKLGPSQLSRPPATSAPAATTVLDNATASIAALACPIVLELVAVQCGVSSGSSRSTQRPHILVFTVCLKSRFIKVRRSNSFAASCQFLALHSCPLQLSCRTSVTTLVIMFYTCSIWIMFTRHTEFSLCSSHIYTTSRYSTDCISVIHFTCSLTCLHTDTRCFISTS